MNGPMGGEAVKVMTIAAGRVQWAKWTWLEQKEAANLFATRPNKACCYIHYVALLPATIDGMQIKYMKYGTVSTTKMQNIYKTYDTHKKLNSRVETMYPQPRINVYRE